MDLFEFAGNMIEKHDLFDITNPSQNFLEITGISQQGTGTASGLNDFDYQNLSILSMGLKNLNQITTVNKVAIPTEIMEHFKNIKCHCMMGLFPEIGRAWLTIDSDIYIWTYEHSRDVAYFDGLSHLIVSVGLIKPKPNVFINDVKYLLVLTTPIEVIVLGVTFGDTTKTVSSPTRSFATTTYEEMQLMNKPIFVLPTDNVAITCVEGTADGRIFLGGRDGCLYEIVYQAESNWFGKRCKKINHSQGLMSYMVPGFLKVFSDNDSIAKIVVDNSRNLLFTLSEKGAIEAWDLSENGTRRIARLSQNDIASYAANVLKTIDASVFKPVTALCTLTNEDSPHIHLIAVTLSGVRLYFSVTQLSLGYQPINQMEPPKPQNLYLLHVRLPPGYTPNTSVGKPKQVHSACYNNGSLLMVSTPQQDQDLLWSLSAEPFPLRPYLAESSTIMPLDGQVWAMAEVKEKTNLSLKFPLKEAQTPKKVVLLTSQGAHIVALLKPVDLLQQLLMACHGAHNDAVKAYFQVQTEPQACATSLLLACMESLRGTDMALWATQAFLLYGGEPSFTNPFLTQQQFQQQQQGRPFGAFNEQQPPNPAQPQEGPRIFMSTPYQQSRPASSVQQSLLQQTQFSANPNISAFQSPQHPQQFPDTSNLNYSAKHTGLYLHLARLLRPIWNRKCVDQNLLSSITVQDCSQVLDDLFVVKAFLDANSVNNLAGLIKMSANQSTILSPNPYGQYAGSNGIIGGAANSVGGPQAQKYTLEEAHAEEKKSLDALIRFIRHTCEVLSLWKILCEHQFNLLIAQLPKEQQQLLMSCSFRDLVLNRTELCAILILTIINFYLSDNASVTSISSKLRDVCPTLYRNEDAVSHKATEILMFSKNCVGAEERDERLRTALQLCKGAAPNLPLTNICQQFTASGFYQGVIELCVSCASKIDPNEAAIHFYKNNEPLDYQEGYLAYSARMECYKEVKVMMEQIYQNLCQATSNLDLIKCGVVLEDREKNITNQILRIVNTALQSQDQLLHVAVYEWLLNHNLLGELLGISEPSLGEFLRRSVARTPENLKLADLLWKYYERNGQHTAAAKILDKLSGMQTDSIPLIQRIEYLARAVMCMRSDAAGYSVHNGELLRELEDKLEIAQVQKQILDTLTNHKPANVDNVRVQEAIKKLNRNLYEMTSLYEDFADAFGLWECKLTILNCSHHNDPLLIESVWTKILDKELDGAESSMEKSNRLLSKVQSLASEYGNSGPCFPLAFLIRELELKCFKLKLPSSPVPEALIHMNLDIDSILDIYLRMISMNERVWITDDDELYLIRAIILLLSILCSQTSLIPIKNRRRTIAKTQDLVSASLNLLYTKPDTQSYIDNLREIQTKLQRIG